MNTSRAHWITLPLWLAACGTAPTVPPVDLRVAPPQTISLRVGQSARFHGMDIVFVGVPTDNRCPIDVACVTAGNALAVVGVGPAVGLGPMHQLQLNTSEWPQQGVALDVRVTLIALEPPPVSTQQLDPNAYVATLRVAGSWVKD